MPENRRIKSLWRRASRLLVVILGEISIALMYKSENEVAKSLL